MKKILVFGFILFAVAKSYSQDYLINFAGTGASTTFDSIKVENITQNTSIVVPGSSQLRLKAIVSGINLISNNLETALRIYPNPQNKFSIVEFKVIKDGNVTIGLSDLSGKQNAQIQSILTSGIHSCRISGLGKGVYVVKVKTADNYYTGKIISQSGNKGKVQITYIENSGELKTSSDSKLKNTDAEVLMQYTTGDRLKITGISGTYRTVFTDIPTGSKTITLSFVGCTDGENNNYPVVTIGSQIWMEENLKTTKLNDGSAIYGIKGGNEWIPITYPAYCWYDNDSLKNKGYGAFYNWYTVNTNKLCPVGWHVPTKYDWTKLEIYLQNNGYNYDGSIDTDTLRDTYNFTNKALGSTTPDWRYRSDDGAIGNTGYPAYRNKSGFTALPAGYLVHYLSTESFVNISNGAQFWSSTMSNNGYSPWSFELNYNTNYVVQSLDTQEEGLSVRCLKDN